LAIALSVHQNIIKILMYVETGQGHCVPGPFIAANLRRLAIATIVSANRQEVGRPAHRRLV